MIFDFMELADYVVAGVTLLLGVGVGKRMRPRPPEPLKPTCSCAHGWGNHEDGRRCHGKVNEATHFQGGFEVAWRKVQCTCLRYDGPDPALFGLDVR